MKRGTAILVTGLQCRRESEQLLQILRAALVCRHVQRCHPDGVTRIDVGPCLQQLPDKPATAQSCGSAVERGPVELADRVHVGLVLEEMRRTSVMAVIDRDPERREPVEIDDLGLRAGFQERSHEIRKPLLRRHVQRGFPRRVSEPVSAMAHRVGQLGIVPEHSGELIQLATVQIPEQKSKSVSVCVGTHGTSNVNNPNPIATRPDYYSGLPTYKLRTACMVSPFGINDHDWLTEHRRAIATHIEVVAGSPEALAVERADTEDPLFPRMQDYKLRPVIARSLLEIADTAVAMIIRGLKHAPTPIPDVIDAAKAVSWPRRPDVARVAERLVRQCALSPDFIPPPERQLDALPEGVPLPGDRSGLMPPPLPQP